MASNACDMPLGTERRGAVDRRHIQQLQSVITESLLGCSRNRPCSSKHNKASLEVPLSTVDVIGNSSGCSLDVPEGLNPDTWAALQQTAKDLDVRGIFDPKINQLRSRMLQQVKAYKGLHAAQAHAQTATAGYAAAAATKAAPPAAASQPEVDTLAGRLEASCAQVIASLPVAVPIRPPHTSGSIVSAASGATYRTGWTCRTNKTGRPPTAVICVSDGTKHRGHPPMRQLQAQPELLAGQCLQGGVQQELPLAGTCSQSLHAVNFPTHVLSSSALQQLEWETSASPITGTKCVYTQQAEGASSSCSCTPAPSIPVSKAAAVLAAGVLEWQHQASMSAAPATAATQQGQETNRSRGSASVGTSGSSSCAGRAAGALTQSLWTRQRTEQLGVVMETHSEPAEVQQAKNKRITLHQKPAKSLAECVAELGVSARPTTPTEQVADTAAAAIQKRLSPAACEAFQASVAAAVDNNLKLYRERLQQARQLLLQKELAEDSTQQLQQMCINCMATSSAASNSDRQGTRGPRSQGGSSDGAPTAAAVTGGSVMLSAAGGESAAGAADAALLTMQQLVSLLAKRDAAPEQVTDSLLEAKQQDGSAAAAPLTATKAASRKLAAAQTMSEFLAAANVHLMAAAAQFDETGMVGSSRHMRLDLGRIARVHQMGKAWHKLTARSIGDSSSSSTAVSTAREERQSSTESSNGQNNDMGGKDSTGRSSSRVMQSPPKPVPPGSAGSAKAWDSTAARVSSAASQQRLQCTPCASSAADLAATKPATAAAAARGAQAVGDADRELAGMRITAPRLQAPTEQELSAVPMPALPELLDLIHEPAKVLQARLQRVWAVLQTPPEQQMDVVLKYTTRAAACSFEEALSAWETAAAAVLQREGILRQLMQVRAAIQEIRHQRACNQKWQQRHICVGFRTQQQQAGEDGPSAKGGSAPQQQQQQRLLVGLDAHQIHQLLWAFLAATEQVKVAAEVLQSITGQRLAVGAVPYPGPGAVSSASQLQLMLDEAWEVLGTGMIYS